jgi:hypothetical protein
MTISKTWRARMATLAVGALVLAACGGDDDDDAAPGADATEEENADGADDEGAATADAGDDNDGDDNDGDDEGSVEVDDLGDLPDECVDALGEMLERIEPIVEDVDWENANLDELGSIGEEIEAEASEIGDDELEERCSQFAFEDGADMAAIKELAEDRAPGVLGYLTFIENMQEQFSEMTIPEISVPDVSLPDISLPDVSIPDVSMPDISMPDVSLPADAPQTCEDAIAFVEGLMEQADTMMDLPINDLTAFGTASTVISTECSLDEMSEFFNRPDVTQWMSGT